MSVVILLMLASLAVGLVFVVAFVWSVRSGQYEDTLTPSMRVLLDDATSANVAQTSKSAVSQVSKPAEHTDRPRAADLEIGDTAGLETCGTPQQPRKPERTGNETKAPWSLGDAAAGDGRAPGTGRHRRFESKHKL